MKISDQRKNNDASLIKKTFFYITVKDPLNLQLFLLNFFGYSLVSVVIPVRICTIDGSTVLTYIFLKKFIPFSRLIKYIKHIFLVYWYRKLSFKSNYTFDISILQFKHSGVIHCHDHPIRTNINYHIKKKIM